MKRLVLMGASLAIFGGAAYLGSTGAFFSDTETSTGNVFTAGAIDLTVDSTSHYAGLVCVANIADAPTGYHWALENAEGTTTRPDLLNAACSGSWTATDLGAANQFFNFGDVKPGDPGEDTVSLHINNNDAWACMDLTTNSNNENDLIEPEASAGDITPGPIGGGELAQNLSFTTWRDNASTEGATPGDNIHQAGEQILSGPVTASSLLGATTSLALADATTLTGPMTGGATNYVGIAWCVGTQTVNPNGSIGCDGSTVPNTVQTDSATSTVSFRVVQSRNNPNFTCGTATEPIDLFSESFENGGSVDWANFSVNIPDIDTHVPSGAEGIPAFDGGFFATTTGDAFTHWGSYSSTFPAGGYTTQVSVYLDMNKATLGDASDTGYFDFSSAINKQDGNHLRDFIFHVGHNPATGNWAATVSNNSSDDSTLPQADQPQNTGADPFQIGTTGWYTLQSYFHDNGSGVLAVTMNLLNSSGTVLHTWTLSDPTDVIATTVGGHRYGWFTAQPFELAFDKARYYLGAPN